MQRKKKSDDPILPIIDIVCGALTKHDYTTVKDGLRAIKGRVKQIFEREQTIDSSTEKTLSKHIFSHLTRVGKLAVSEEDEESVREVIIAIQEIGESATKRKLADTTLKTIKFIGDLGVKAAENRWTSTTKLSVDSLGDLYVTACANEILGRQIDHAFVSGIQNIASVSIIRDLRFSIDSVAPSFRDICLKIIEKCLKQIKISTKSNMYSTIRNTIGLDIAVVAIGNILNQAFEDKVIDQEGDGFKKFEEIIKYIAEIGAELAVADNLEYVNGRKKNIDLNGEDWCTSHLNDVFNWAIDNKNISMIEKFMKVMRNFSNDIPAKYTGGFYSGASEIANLPLKYQHELMVKYRWIIRLLKNMGNNTINKSLYSTSEEIIEIIKKIGDQIKIEDHYKFADESSKQLKEALGNKMNENSKTQSAMSR
jgi:hypothetical protein